LADETPWVTDHIELPLKAWQAALDNYVTARTKQRAGQSAGAPLRLAANLNWTLDRMCLGGEAMHLAANDSGGGDNGGDDFGAGDGNQPGDSGRQRGGLGGEDPSADDKQAAIDAIQAELDEVNFLKDAYDFDPLIDWAKDHGYDGYDYNNALNNMLKQMAEQGYTDFDDYWNSLSDQQKNDLFQQSQGTEGTEAPMHTDGRSCRIVENWSWGDYLDRYGSETAAKVIQGGDRTHEQHHQDTCKTETEWVWPGRDADQADPDRGEGWGIDPEGYEDYMSDPENYSRDEVEAYQEKANELQEWLDHDC